MKFEEDPSVASSALGSTDMGNVSYVVPSIHPMFNINTKAPNHSREFTADAGKSMRCSYHDGGKVGMFVWAFWDGLNGISLSWYGYFGNKERGGATRMLVLYLCVTRGF